MNIGRLCLKNNIFLAPMAGITDFPFRTIVRSFGCGLAFTEMISATGLVRKSEKTFRYLATSPTDRPLGVQLFGCDPETLAAAAQIAGERGADLLDINMGCPVKKVVKSGSGAALMREPERPAAIIRAVRKASALPLTVKIRAGWNGRQVNALDIGEIAEGCGVDAVILHPRTADQGFGGRSDWRLIASLKERLRVPVIGSGDVRCPADADRMFRETGCDGVMVARGVLGNPWLIGNILSHLSVTGGAVPSLSEREEVVCRHLALAIDFYGEQIGTRDFRKHLLWYTKGLRDGARFRRTAGGISDRNSACEALRGYFHDLEVSAAATSEQEGCGPDTDKGREIFREAALSVWEDLPLSDPSRAVK
jgi:tRNA-dihydrouridine synthase B